MYSLGCYDVAAERGMSIPGDFSVVGYNDIPSPTSSNPLAQLTTGRSLCHGGAFLTEVFAVFDGYRGRVLPAGPWVARPRGCDDGPD